MANFGEARDLHEDDFSGTVKDRVSEQADKAKSKLAEVGRKAGQQMDEQRGHAAGALESGAAALHEKAETLPGGPKVTSMAHATANKLQVTADYIREHDASAMVEDVKDVIRRYPGQTLAAGLVVGFFLGRMLRSED